MEAKFIPVNGGDAMRQLVWSLHRHRHLYFQYWIFVKFTHKSEPLRYIYKKRQKQTLGNSKVSIAVVKFRERRRDTEPSLPGDTLAVQLLEPQHLTPLWLLRCKRNKFTSCNKLLFLVSFLCRRSNWSRADSYNVNWKCFLCRKARNHHMTFNQANIRNLPAGWNSRNFLFEMQLVSTKELRTLAIRSLHGRSSRDKTSSLLSFWIREAHADAVVRG